MSPVKAKIHCSQDCALGSNINNGLVILLIAVTFFVVNVSPIANTVIICRNMRIGHVETIAVTIDSCSLIGMGTIGKRIINAEESTNQTVYPIANAQIFPLQDAIINNISLCTIHIITAVGIGNLHGKGIRHTGLCIGVRRNGYFGGCCPRCERYRVGHIKYAIGVLFLKSHGRGTAGISTCDGNGERLIAWLNLQRSNVCANPLEICTSLAGIVSSTTSLILIRV